MNPINVYTRETKKKRKPIRNKKMLDLKSKPTDELTEVETDLKPRNKTDPFRKKLEIS